MSDEAPAEKEIFDVYACLDGDCPHEKQRDCFIAAFRLGLYHERQRSEGLLKFVEKLTVADRWCLCRGSDHICLKCSARQVIRDYETRED